MINPDQKSVLQMATAFHEHGWSMVAVGDILLAQAIVRKENPSAIVLSSALPGGGAVAVVKSIRCSVYTVGTPVVVLANSHEGKEEEFLAAGANSYIQGFDIGLLCKALDEYLTPPASLASVPVLAPVEIIAGAERKAALTSAQVLDTSPYKLLDDITKIASCLLRVPTAVLSIVDIDRQFFKSQIGVQEPYSSARETPMTHSFCQWVVSGNEELVVDDARQLPALKSNFAVSKLGVIAYAGVPVYGETGPALGSFCAIDSKPHSWTSEEIVNLRDLAQMAEAAMLLEKMDHARASPVERVEKVGSVIQHGGRILRRNDQALSPDIRGLLLEIIEGQAGEIARAHSSSK